MFRLTDFEICRPAYELSQDAGLEWLVAAHAESESRYSNTDKEVFLKRLQQRVQKVCCTSSHIGKRGHILNDFLHKDWEAMQIYDLSRSPTGLGLKERTQIFCSVGMTVMEKFYPTEKNPPKDLIHVTCTGYSSPSLAQRIVNTRKWQQRTTVTHAYHMGCLAAIPAIRIAHGFSQYRKERIDVVHTEISTLHFNPALHSSEQLVGQSLFADGFIKYSYSKEEKPGFCLLVVDEQMIEDTTSLMAWECEDWGFRMTLSKEIPFKIHQGIVPFVKSLFNQAGISEGEIQKAYFAVHPGGPKILSLVKEALGLEEGQMKDSLGVLYDYGNMSSATLPHIWERMLKDPSIAVNSYVVSLGFGPGLTVGGMIFQKK